QINPTRHRREVIYAGRFAHVEELLQLARLPMQAVKVVDDHPVNRPGAQVTQQLPVRGSDPALVSRHVLVDVALDDPPTTLLRNPLATLQLPANRKPIALPIRRDPRIDTRPPSHG